MLAAVEITYSTVTDQKEYIGKQMSTHIIRETTSGTLQLVTKRAIVTNAIHHDGITGTCDWIMGLGETCPIEPACGRGVRASLLAYEYTVERQRCSIVLSTESSSLLPPRALL